MTKFFSVVIACATLIGVASAQGKPDPRGNGVIHAPGPREPIEHGPKKRLTMTQRIKLVRKTQTESSHVRFKLGLMGVNPMVLGASAGGASMLAHSGHFGTSAISLQAETRRHSMLAAYGSQQTAAFAGFTTADRLKASARLQVRVTGTRIRRVDLVSKQKKDRLDRMLTGSNKDLLAKAKAKGLKNPNDVTASTRTINPATLRGSSAQADASSSSNPSSIYRNVAGFGQANTANSKAKGAAQSNPTGHQSQGSIYKTGN